jgi:hypothetical protein
MTSLILYSTAVALLIPICWIFWKQRKALRKWTVLATVAVWYGDEFLVHMMRKPDLYVFLRWGILALGYALLSFLWFRDKQPEAPA